MPCNAPNESEEKFRGYLEGIRFIVHCQLPYVNEDLDSPDPLMVVECERVRLELRYRKGSISVVSDVLPRTVAEAVFTVHLVQDSWYRKLVDRMKMRRI